VGFTNLAILLLVVGETVVIALVGGLLGTMLSYAATAVMSNALVVFFQGFYMPWWSAPVCLLVAVMIGFLSSLGPATVAIRTTIVDALRHSG
jgi:putative ABC transport system permease protein